MNPALHSSKDHTWQTPDEVLERVRQLGRISLDPCTTKANPTNAAAFCATRGRGLSWHASAIGDGPCFVNPPYGRDLPLWVDKAIEEAAHGLEIILLVPARTDTQWFDRALHSSQALALWRGRITFKGADAGAPFPSALFYWGRRRWDFARAFRDAANVNVHGSWTGRQT